MSSSAERETTAKGRGVNKINQRWLLVSEQAMPFESLTGTLLCAPKAVSCDCAFASSECDFDDEEGPSKARTAPLSSCSSSVPELATSREWFWCDSGVE